VVALPIEPAMTLPSARLVARQPRTPRPERLAALDAHEPLGKDQANAILLAILVIYAISVSVDYGAE
jgi:hypothetical protein